MKNNLASIENKSRVAIVSVGYNRIKSQKRQLGSLLRADYSGFDNVPLVISIDCSGDEALYEYVKQFEWPYGDKHVLIREKRMGLKDHIFSCGDLTQYFKGIILLEDDIYVAKDFYNYSVDAMDYYANDEKVASISLYCNEMNGFAWLPMKPIRNKYDVFAMPCVSTWGEGWTSRMWGEFREWMKETEIEWNKVDMPGQIKKWDRAWSKFFDAYMAVKDKYSIFPYTSLTTNFSDAGEHGGNNNTIVQVGLQYGNNDYRFGNFDELIRYTNYGLSLLPQILGVNKDDFYVNLQGKKDAMMDRRYFLSVKPLPYKVVKSFGLFMRPWEINIIENVEGNDMFLYDRTIKDKKPKGKGISNLILYHLHGFNYWYLLWGAYLRTCQMAKKAWHKYVK